MDHRKHVNMSKAANVQPGLGTTLADLTWLRNRAEGVYLLALLVVLRCVGMIHWCCVWVIETSASVILISQPDVSYIISIRDQRLDAQPNMHYV